jgi:hypothetical protein
MTESSGNEGKGTLVDRRIRTWRTQRWIALAYLIFAVGALVSWGQGFTVFAFVAASVAWLGQWAATAALIAFLSTRIGRFLRHSWLVALVLIVVISAMAILTVMVFGVDARTDGWTVVWRVLATLWISSFSVRYERLRQVLQQEQAAQESLRAVRSQNLDAVRTQRLEVLDRVAGLMNTALKKSAVDSQQAAEDISQLARDVVRPLSHEVMNEDPLARRLDTRERRRSSWREVAASVASRPALRPWLMATVVFWAFFVTTADTVDQTPIDASEASGVNVMIDTEQFVITVALFIGIFFVTAFSALILQRILTSMLPRLGLAPRVIYLVAAPILIAVIVEIYVQLVYVVPGFAEELSGNLLVRLLPAMSILAVALLVVLNRSLAETLRNSEQRAKDLTRDLAWEQSRLQCTFAREQRFFASQLHGPLQSLLTSAAMRMVANEPGTPQWQAALSDVRTDFETIMERLVTGPDGPIDLTQSLDELRRTWAGVCEIDIAIDDDVMATLNSEWISAGIVNDILVEACANAAMHGKAANVHIGISWCADEEILITVTNDGSPDDRGAPGLGSDLFDRVAIHWAREVTPEGLRLSLGLAVPRDNPSVDRSTTDRIHAEHGLTETYA